MKNYKLIKIIILGMLLCSSFLATAQAVTNPPSKAMSQISVGETGNQAKRSASYSGYEVDGRTSASVLAAKRSHSVSKQDENGLAIFSGIFVICLIVFFTQVFWKKH